MDTSFLVWDQKTPVQTCQQTVVVEIPGSPILGTKMKATEEKLGSVKRFGARYGRKTKLKFSKIEFEQRRLHKCPYCSKTAVKRVAMGIWHCRKCNAKFTGKAYSISKKIITKGPAEIIEEQPIIEKEETGEEESEQA